MSQWKMVMQSGPHGSVIARYDDGKNAEVKRGAPRVDLNLPHSRDEEARARFHNELMMKFRLLPSTCLNLRQKQLRQASGFSTSPSS